jgi:hypothetical protein
MKEIVFGGWASRFWLSGLARIRKLLAFFFSSYIRMHEAACFIAIGHQCHFACK